MYLEELDRGEKKDLDGTPEMSDEDNCVHIMCIFLSYQIHSVLYDLNPSIYYVRSLFF